MIYTFKEYIDNNIINLNRYINMTEQEKKEDLIQIFKDVFKKWIITYYEFKIPEITEKIGKDIDIDNVDEILNTFPDIKQSFKNWLYEKVNDNYGEILHVWYDIPYTRMPSWIFFDKNKSEIIKNQWLIHFTDTGDVTSIAKTGFKLGTSNMKMLGLTYNRKTVDKSLGGYNFAYTLDDYIKYNDPDLYYHTKRKCKIFLSELF